MIDQYPGPNAPEDGDHQAPNTDGIVPAPVPLHAPRRRRGRPVAWGASHAELVARVAELRRQGFSIRQIAEEVGHVSKSTVAALIVGGSGTASEKP